jgi:sec-independent protein translocase protein TatB
VLNLDPAKLLVIAVVAVILLGPDKLPQFARQVGAAWRSLNDFRHRMEAEVRDSMPDLPSSAEIARLARSPGALLNHLSNMSPGGEETDTAAAGTVVDETMGGDAMADGAAVVAGPESGAANAVANGTAAHPAVAVETNTDVDSNGLVHSLSNGAADTNGAAHATSLAPAGAPEGFAPGDPGLN